ncbi:hypothetical protein Pam4_56 [Pseudanabaena phage Pam4]|nr:hypothetical protein Pam4_56 [Pseudanabaena phage Pam4]
MPVVDLTATVRNVGHTARNLRALAAQHERAAAVLRAEAQGLDVLVDTLAGHE